MIHIKLLTESDLSIWNNFLSIICLYRENGQLLKANGNQSLLRKIPVIMKHGLEQILFSVKKKAYKHCIILTSDEEMTSFIGWAFTGFWSVSGVSAQLSYKKSNKHTHYSCLFVCLFVFLCVCLFVLGGLLSHSRIFSYMETPPLPGKGCKVWPMLGSHGHWAVKVL